MFPYSFVLQLASHVNRIFTSHILYRCLGKTAQITIISLLSFSLSTAHLSLLIIFDNIILDLSVLLASH